MYQTLFTDKKWGKIIFGPEVEWTAFSGTYLGQFIFIHFFIVITFLIWY